MAEPDRERADRLEALLRETWPLTEVAAREYNSLAEAEPADPVPGVGSHKPFSGHIRDLIDLAVSTTAKIDSGELPPF